MTGPEILKYRMHIPGVQFRVKKDGEWLVVGAPMVAGADLATMGRFSGQYSSDKKAIFEGDICECDVIVDMAGIRSLIKRLGVMVYSEERCQFLFEMVYDTQEKLEVTVTNVKILGNITDNPELICPKPQA